MTKLAVQIGFDMYLIFDDVRKAGPVIEALSGAAVYRARDWKGDILEPVDQRLVMSFVDESRIAPPKPVVVDDHDEVGNANDAPANLSAEVH